MKRHIFLFKDDVHQKEFSWFSLIRRTKVWKDFSVHPIHFCQSLHGRKLWFPKGKFLKGHWAFLEILQGFERKTYCNCLWNGSCSTVLKGVLKHWEECRVLDCMTAVCQYSVCLILYFEWLYKYNSKSPFFPRLLVMQ